jgi:hypothetical protein
VFIASTRKSVFAGAALAIRASIAKARVSLSEQREDYREPSLGTGVKER